MHDILVCTCKAKCKMIHMTPREVTSRSYLFLLLCQYPAGDIAISFIVTCGRANLIMSWPYNTYERPHELWGLWWILKLFFVAGKKSRLGWLMKEQQAELEIYCNSFTSRTKMNVKTTDIVAKGKVTGWSSSHCNTYTKIIILVQK